MLIYFTFLVLISSCEEKAEKVEQIEKVEQVNVRTNNFHSELIKLNDSLSLDILEKGFIDSISSGFTNAPELRQINFNINQIKNMYEYSSKSSSFILSKGVSKKILKDKLGSLTNFYFVSKVNFKKSSFLYDLNYALELDRTALLNKLQQKSTNPQTSRSMPTKQ